MHVKDESAFAYVNLAKSCIEECAAFAAEIDLDLASGFDIMEIFRMRGDKRLESFYSKKRYQKIRRRILKAFDLDIAGFANLVPMFAINAVSEKLLSKGNPLPLDLTLWMHAKRNQKYCFGVENFQEHYEVLHIIPYEYQAAQLYALSKNVSAVHKEIKAITKAYKNSDIKKIYKKAKTSLGSMRGIMLYDRNDIIANKIMDTTDKGKLFCAVGAAHLYGKNGIIAQLKRNNYKVKAISLQENTEEEVIYN